MLIGIDASRANKPNKTGTEWYSYHLIQWFKKLDKENRYFLYTNVPLKDGLENCPENFEEKILNWPPGRLWTQFRLSYEMLVTRLRDFCTRLYRLQDVRDKTGKEPDRLFVSAHVIPLFHPKKTVVTMHDIGFERFPKIYPWYDIVYHKYALRFAKFSAWKIITISEFSKKEIMDVFKIPAEKIKVVYNGFDAGNYKIYPAEEIESIKLKYGLNSPYFIFTGRLEEKKNTPFLVECFAEFKKSRPECKLVLVGNTKTGSGFVTHGFERVKENIEKFGLQKDVITPGWVGVEDLSKLTAGARALVFPSLYEGFGIPPLEAMACGCPVICSNTTSLPEVAGDAALLIDPKSKEEIVRAMNKIDADENLRKELIAKGFENIKRFSWEKCARETLEVILGD
ncbi:MAG TPA: glycosyltransferase family 1 protein [Candidatus Bipolaricaulota bacterium]|nr:glycosyltransferase family 1 protein [Candidatus Bipolaricaulota bacterium]